MSIVENTELPNLSVDRLRALAESEGLPCFKKFTDNNKQDLINLIILNRQACALEKEQELPAMSSQFTPLTGSSVSSASSSLPSLSASSFSSLPSSRRSQPPTMRDWTPPAEFVFMRNVSGRSLEDLREMARANKLIISGKETKQSIIDAYKEAEKILASQGRVNPFAKSRTIDPEVEKLQFRGQRCLDYKLAQLKTFAKALGLKQSGTKEDLCKLLADFERRQQREQEEEEVMETQQISESQEAAEVQQALQAAIEQIVSGEESSRQGTATRERSVERESRQIASRQPSPVAAVPSRETSEASTIREVASVTRRESEEESEGESEGESEEELEEEVTEKQQGASERLNEFFRASAELHAFASDSNDVDELKAATEVAADLLDMVDREIVNESQIFKRRLDESRDESTKQLITAERNASERIAKQSSLIIKSTVNTAVSRAAEILGSSLTEIPDPGTVSIITSEGSLPVLWINRFHGLSAELESLSGDNQPASSIDLSEGMSTLRRMSEELVDFRQEVSETIASEMITQRDDANAVNALTTFRRALVSRIDLLIFRNFALRTTFRERFTSLVITQSSTYGQFDEDVREAHGILNVIGQLPVTSDEAARGLVQSSVNVIKLVFQIVELFESLRSVEPSDRAELHLTDLVRRTVDIISQSVVPSLETFIDFLRNSSTGDIRSLQDKLEFLKSKQSRQDNSSVIACYEKFLQMLNQANELESLVQSLLVLLDSVRKSKYNRDPPRTRTQVGQPDVEPMSYGSPPTSTPIRESQTYEKQLQPRLSPIVGTITEQSELQVSPVVVLSSGSERETKAKRLFEESPVSGQSAKRPRIGEAQMSPTSQPLSTEQRRAEERTGEESAIDRPAALRESRLSSRVQEPPMSGAYVSAAELQRVPMPVPTPIEVAPIVEAGSQSLPPQPMAAVQQQPQQQVAAIPVQQQPQPMAAAAIPGPSSRRQLSHREETSLRLAEALSELDQSRLELQNAVMLNKDAEELSRLTGKLDQLQERVEQLYEELSSKQKPVKKQPEPSLDSLRDEISRLQDRLRAHLAREVLDVDVVDKLTDELDKVTETYQKRLKFAQEKQRVAPKPQPKQQPKQQTKKEPPSRPTVETELLWSSTGGYATSILPEIREAERTLTPFTGVPVRMQAPPTQETVPGVVGPFRIQRPSTQETGPVAVSPIRIPLPSTRQSPEIVPSPVRVASTQRVETPPAGGPVIVQSPVRVASPTVPSQPGAVVPTAPAATHTATSARRQSEFTSSPQALAPVVVAPVVSSGVTPVAGAGPQPMSIQQVEQRLQNVSSPVTVRQEGLADLANTIFASIGLMN